MHGQHTQQQQQQRGSDVPAAIAAMAAAVQRGDFLVADELGRQASYPLSLPKAALRFLRPLSEGAQATVYEGSLLLDALPAEVQGSMCSSRSSTPGSSQQGMHHPLGAQSMRDEPSGHSVAVAVKKPRIRESADLDRFRAEVGLLARLQHPGLVRLVGARLLPPEYSVVLGLEATNAAEELHGAGWRPGWGAVAALGRQLAGALAHMHANGVMHRDVKPANILLDAPRTTARLGDLGLATSVEEAAAAAPLAAKPTGGFHKQHMVGTLEYMAPEVLLGGPAGRHSPAADVYALAVTLAELGTGVPPFSDATRDNPLAHTVLEMGYGRQELAAAVAAEGLRPTLPPSTPTSVRALLEASWRREPSARPRAADVAARLAALAGELGALSGGSVQGERSVQGEPGDAPAPSRVAVPPMDSASWQASAQQAQQGAGAAGSDSRRRGGGLLFCTSGSKQVSLGLDGSQAAIVSPSMPAMAASPAGLAGERSAGSIASNSLECAGAVIMSRFQPAASLAGPATPARGGRWCVGALPPWLHAALISTRHTQDAETEGVLLPGQAGSSQHRQQQEGPQLQQPPTAAGDELGSPQQWQRHPQGSKLAAPAPAVAAFASAGARGADRMEDRHLILRDLGGWEGVTVFGVFDGHRGSEAADYLAANLEGHLAARWHSARSAGELLAGALADADEAYRAQHEAAWALRVATVGAAAAGQRPFPGSTALVALTAGSLLAVANLGDSRAVVCRGGGALELTSDQVADRADERQRVAAAGGTLRHVMGSWRVGAAGMQVTRSIGDADLKPEGVTAEAEVTELTLTPDDAFLIIATDGVWDQLGSGDAVGLVMDTVKQPAMCAQRLVTEALTRGSQDNLTAVVAILPLSNHGSPGSAERVFASAAAQRRLRQGGRKEQAQAPPLVADEVADTY
ncbi:hypothetical protein N2152v2_002783 [Parachlorella kessleri]